MKWFLIHILALFFLTSCAAHKSVITDTTHQTDTVVRTDTVRLTKFQRDSVAIHDSVFVSVATRGDTVEVVKYRYKTCWRDRWHTDSVYISKHDTVTRRDTMYVQRKVIEEVEKPPSMWQRIKMSVGGVLVGLIIAIVVTLAIHLFPKFRAWW